MPYPYRTAGTTRAIGTERSPVTRRTIGTRRVLPTIDYLVRWGVVEHWAGNEASGARLASISSANDMTAVNAPTSNPGLVYPLARQYTSASNMYHSLADNAAVSTGDIDFWIAGWAYFDTLANETIASKWLVNQKEWLLFYNHTDHATNARFSFAVSGDGSTSSLVDATTFGAPSTATWYFVMAYHDSVTNLIGISVNGGVFNTAAYATGVIDGTSSLEIGRLPTTYYMNGRIGPVTFGKSPPGGIAALATEIRDRLYNSGSGRVYPFR